MHKIHEEVQLILWEKKLGRGSDNDVSVTDVLVNEGCRCEL